MASWDNRGSGSSTTAGQGEFEAVDVFFMASVLKAFDCPLHELEHEAAKAVGVALSLAATVERDGCEQRSGTVTMSHAR
jgi:hypothetical protein